MAKIQTPDRAHAWPLPSGCLIGRSRTCSIRLDTAETSGEHALLRWRSGAWELQDLHSRNGTYVDGRRLEAGHCLSLHEGASLGFGRPGEYVLIDAGPPQPHAIALTTPARAVEPHAGLLTLPDPESPEVTVLYRDQRWWVERADGILPVTDGEVIQTQSGPWRLHLPEPLPLTRDAEDLAPTLSALALRITLNPDQSAAELMLTHGGRRLELKGRAHHALLLALARQRVDDRDRPSDERGWIDQEELLRRIGHDSNRLHVEIHRLRRQLAALGVLDAVHIIDRRAHQLRIGLSKLELLPAP